MGKKVIAAAACLLAPSVFPTLFAFFISKYSFVADNESVISIYAGSVLFVAFGFYAFYKWRPCSPWIIPVGFLLSALPYLIYETIDPPSWFKYMGTTIVAIFYSAPFTIAALVFAIVLTTREKRQNNPGQE